MLIDAVVAGAGLPIWIGAFEMLGAAALPPQAAVATATASIETAKARRAEGLPPSGMIARTIRFQPVLQTWRSEGLRPIPEKWPADHA
jgi:hypothetical protein